MIKKSNMFKLISMIVLIYLVLIILSSILQDTSLWIENIIIYSSMGFAAFFVGYFGLGLAKNLGDAFTGKKN